MTNLNNIHKIDGMINIIEKLWNYFDSLQIDYVTLADNLHNMREKNEVDYKFIGKYVWLKDQKEIEKYIRRQKTNIHLNAYDYTISNRCFYQSDEQYKLFNSII